MGADSGTIEISTELFNKDNLLKEELLHLRNEGLITMKNNTFFAITNNKKGSHFFGELPSALIISLTSKGIEKLKEVKKEEFNRLTIIISIIIGLFSLLVGLIQYYHSRHNE